METLTQLAVWKSIMFKNYLIPEINSQFNQLCVLKVYLYLFKKKSAASFLHECFLMNAFKIFLPHIKKKNIKYKIRYFILYSFRCFTSLNQKINSNETMFFGYLVKLGII